MKSKDVHKGEPHFHKKIRICIICEANLYKKRGYQHIEGQLVHMTSSIMFHKIIIAAPRHQQWLFHDVISSDTFSRFVVLFLMFWSRFLVPRLNGRPHFHVWSQFHNYAHPCS